MLSDTNKRFMPSVVVLKDILLTVVAPKRPYKVGPWRRRGPRQSGAGVVVSDRFDSRGQNSGKHAENSGYSHRWDAPLNWKEWKGSNHEQSARWQHVSRLKASAFCIW